MRTRLVPGGQGRHGPARAGPAAPVGRGGGFRRRRRAPGRKARARAARRYLLREAVVAWLGARFPKWPAIDAALSREGWKLVTLLRLSPLVPWNVLNYALSVTGARSNLPYLP